MRVWETVFGIQRLVQPGEEVPSSFLNTYVSLAEIRRSVLPRVGSARKSYAKRATANTWGDLDGDAKGLWKGINLADAINGSIVEYINLGRLNGNCDDNDDDDTAEAESADDQGK